MRDADRGLHDRADISKVTELGQEQAIVGWVERRIPEIQGGPDIAGLNRKERADIHEVLLVGERDGALVDPIHAIGAAIAMQNFTLGCT